MSTMKLLAFDTETGGLDPKDSSLLTAYFEVLDSDFKTLDSLYLRVKPNGEDLIKANPSALAINKIDLTKHQEIAIPYAEASQQLLTMLTKHSSKYDKLVPVAHNIDFDLGFVFEYLASKKVWDSLVSYRKLDTANLANFFTLTGHFPSNQKFSLGEVAKSMEINFDGDAHSADADTKVMIQVLKKFVETGKTF